MFDVDLIRQNREAVEDMLKRRNADAPLDDILALDDKRLDLVREINRLREERNRITQQIPGCKDAAEKQELIETNRKLRQRILELEEELRQTEADLKTLLLYMPNMVAPDVPYGEDDSQNVEIKRWGTPREFPFTPLDHVDIGENLGIVDIARGTKIMGSRGYLLKNEAIHLELALIRFALDILQPEGFVPVIPPVMVKEEILVGTRHYPFFKDQIYRIEGENLGLVGTSEIPLAAIHADEILSEDDLPLKYVGISPCYRTEVGSGGKDIRGLMRVHQFDKVEIFIFSEPSRSEEMHEYILSLEEQIYQALEIPYRVVNICTGDLGPIAYKKYDIEFWRPFEGKYREITSCSNCTDFQSRGLNVRYRPKDGEKTRFVHTLNGTAIAISRTLVAILENYQQKDGSVVIPTVLRKYMPGQMSVMQKKN
ncbi:MAG TPA: serine--tRNA ligase [Bacillota bacterium]|nr:serine--tRNA ligase [Bacillota bacterium]HPZ78765.1 serine--tRNA ligase [Bacillota bacterium]